jgi:hypothetical protein
MISTIDASLAGNYNYKMPMVLLVIKYIRLSSKSGLYSSSSSNSPDLIEIFKVSSTLGIILKNMV